MLFSHYYRLAAIIWLAVFLALFGGGRIASAQDAAVVTPEHPLQVLRTGLFVYEDTSARATFPEIRNKDSLFAAHKGKTIDFGYTSSAVWVRFKVRNETASPLYVEVLTPSIDTLDFYAVTAQGQLKRLRSGYHVPFESRGLQITMPNFKLPENTDMVYIRAKSDHGLQVPVRVGTMEAVAADAQRYNALNSLMLGVIIFILAYSLFKAVTSKDPLYLYYMPLLLVVIFSIMRGNGYDAWLLPSITRVGIIVIPLLALLSLPFYIKFLDLRSMRKQGILVMLFLLGIVYSITSILALLGMNSLAAQVYSNQPLVTTVVVFLMALWVYIKGYRLAIYFIVAYLFLIAGAFINVLLSNGVLPYNVWTANALSIGSAIQITLFTLAIAEKTDRHKREIDKAKEQALEAAEKHAEELDGKVRERTKELQHTTEELRISDKELRQYLEELQSTQEILEKRSQALVEKEEQLRRIFNGAPAMIYQFKLDTQGNMSFPIVSKGAKAIYGISPEAIMENANVLLEVLHPDDLERFQSSIEESAQTMQDWHEELRRVVDGKEKWAEGFASPEKQRDGSIIWSGMIMDIDQRKLIELEVKKQQDTIVGYNALMKDALDEARKQRELVYKKHEDMMSSLNYAKRIQTAMLPQAAKITKSLPDSFVFYRPRDVVSGDFYWMHETPSYLYISTMDCTGHGVPGAFMSLIGNSLLNEAVCNQEMTKPHHILQFMQIGLIKRLKQEGTYTRDGMEGAVCVLDKEQDILHYSGAKGPLVYVENGELKVIKGDRQGIAADEGGKRFTTHEVPIASSICCYLFSDGYQDQFGGEKGRKFMSKRLRRFLFEGHHLPFKEQGARVKHEFDDWKGEERQVDDVMLVGFKISSQKVKANTEAGPTSLPYS